MIRGNVFTDEMGGGRATKARKWRGANHLDIRVPTIQLTSGSIEHSGKRILIFWTLDPGKSKIFRQYISQ